MIKKPTVELSQLGKGYQESTQQQVIFKDLTLSVIAGEFIVLLGRSGSGKSTLLIYSICSAVLSSLQRDRFG